jgi:hypothetical protein
VAEAFLLPPHLKLFWTGLRIYAISFVLFATAGSAGDGRMLGFMCAFFAFVLPVNEATLALFHNVPLSIPPVPYVSLIIAGWINPIFLVIAFLILTGLHQRLVAILKVAVVLMLPFTWLFFATFRMYYPREGHFLWVVGILLGLFSGRIAGGETGSIVD